MSVVYKYPVHPNGEQIVNMPSSSQIVSAIVQNGTIFLYAIVPDVKEPLTARKISVVGTGWGFRRAKRFIDTVQDGSFVWHIFEDYMGPQPV